MNPSMVTPPSGRASFRRRALALIAAGAASTAGCYKYTPVPVQTPPGSGEGVRVSVTREAALEFVDALNVVAEAVPRVEGKLEGIENGTFVLRVPVPSSEVGLNTGIDQLIRVPQSQVIGLERKELDAVGTGLLVAGSAAAASLLLLQIISATGGDDGGGGDGPDLAVRIPIGRFTISR